MIFLSNDSRFPKRHCFSEGSPDFARLLFWQDEDEYGALVQWQWQGKTAATGEEPVRVVLRTPQISRGLAWDRIWASAMRNWRLTAWSKSRPGAHQAVTLRYSCIIIKRQFLLQNLREPNSSSFSRGLIEVHRKAPPPSRTLLFITRCSLYEMQLSGSSRLALVNLQA